MLCKLLYSLRCVVFLVVVLLFFFACSDVENPGGGFIPPPEATLARIVLDQSAYSGYFKPATLIVQDTNNTNSSVDVSVTSLADPVGITLQLSNSGTNFIGTLWFTNSNSVAGQTIKATNNDMLRLIYNEPDPDGKRIKYTQWFSVIAYDIYDSIYARGLVIEAGSYNLGFPEHTKEPSYYPVYGTNYSTTTVYDAAYTSGRATQFYLWNAYFYVLTYEPLDLSLFRSGYLCFTMTATNNLDIKLVWNGGQDAIVKAADYMVLDNTPQTVRIPLSDFTGLDMSTFSGFFVAWMQASRAYFALEEVRFEL